MPPLNLAIVGLGGFAQVHHRAAATLEREGACRVVAACDPAPEKFDAFTAELNFAARGIKVYRDYRELLQHHAAGLDAITIPTPVPLHAEMHAAAVDRGVPVYLEKPPTLDYRELETMLAVEQRARRATNVGFNFIGEPARRRLKERLLAGDFGTLRRLSFLGLAPRGLDYYARAGWAGRLRVGERLVLDSCLGNACSHFLHNLLFWAGRELDAWATPEAVTAELYRAHRIESFDTVFARIRVPGSVRLRLAITHAINPGPARAGQQEETIECERAVITYRPSGYWQVLWRDGRREYSREANFRAYLDSLAGRAARPLTRLADTRPFVHCYDLVLLAAGRIVTIGDQILREDGWQAGDAMVAFDEIIAACLRFHWDGIFPSEAGVTWAKAGGTAVPVDLPRLPALIERLCAESGFRASPV